MVTCYICGQRTRQQDLLSHQIRKRCLESKLKHDVVCAVKCMARKVRLHQNDLDLQHRHLMRHFGRSITSLSDQSNRGPLTSTAKQEIIPCRKCNKFFKPNQNSPGACRWHLGPIVNLFGGTCSSCGRLDYQNGCIVGCHET
ncbi:E3 ubiquitin-protein ligase PDZRN3 [Biomphalaria pfeifferi]|uniref:E3 ubiquitin-protein ligase PDZRN3 n=1 Tax=Biomphalaria pfeifferi TaxID=112525 RepID=A0AAD8F436_BIOPF|nr:E3 ubiquitin-protein ligase PDZRN3 [Biomphalaria pfeifferi]